jgi:hypothetical protein
MQAELREQAHRSNSLLTASPVFAKGGVLPNSFSHWKVEANSSLGPKKMQERVGPACLQDTTYTPSK